MTESKPGGVTPHVRLTLTLTEARVVLGGLPRKGAVVDKVTLAIAAAEERMRRAAPYTDDRYCETCQTETEHVCQDSGHERDSSGDSKRCTICDTHKLG